ncbi:MAG: ribosome maturation factor RimP [Myxococcales bacterium]|nr:ribosome maturation factor RimP [Myxococcales bacterium]
MAESNPRQSIEDKAWALAEPLLAAEGLELLDVEFVREHGWILRLYIDVPGDQVGVDECAIASRAVDRALDVEDFIPHEYSLEVSSPGLNRPLRKAKHFEQVKGKQVRVKTYGPLFEPPRKNFVGTLTDVQPEAVVVEVDGAGPFTIPLKDIARANLEFDFEADKGQKAAKPGKPGKPGKHGKLGSPPPESP